MVNNSERKKIGIITFHRAINYGAILQVYALQEKIKQLGGDSIVLDYRNEMLEKKHKKIRILESKNIKDLLRYLLIGKNYNKKYKKFRDFSNEYLNLSKVYNNLNELKQHSNYYDKFICGSDQVWNYLITDFDTAYFLNFTNEIHKKNSYAASFGINKVPEIHHNKYFELLKNFNNISIREKQGAKLINYLLKKETEVVLDPTLLITKNEWIKIANNNPFRKKYILVYAFGGSKYIMSLAKKLSKKTGYKIVVISNNYRKSTNVKYIKSAGPKDWLTLFIHAEYIITNSFHGTAFSINFNKQFCTEFLPESYGVNSRLEDILELFDLSDRRILSDDLSIFDKNIDYEKVNNILQKEREKSIYYLKKIIKE